MDLTLKQLCAFVAVAESEQFTRAAERLDLSQSAVSSLVRQLEQNLGVRLFDRHTRLLRLTEAGTESLPIIKRAIVDIESVIEGTKELKLLRRGRLAIAAGTMQAALSLPSIIREFCDAHPMISITLQDVPESNIAELVRSGVVEVGIGSIPEGEPDLAELPLVGDNFLVVMPPSHPLASKPILYWRDLANAPLIGPHPENPIRRRLEVELAREKISFKSAYEVMLPLTMIGMVEAGLGVAVMTASVGRLAKAMGLIARVPAKPVIERNISLITRRDRTLSPAARQFRDFVYRTRRAQMGGDHAVHGANGRKSAKTNLRPNGNKRR
jgi:LysR family carnitine catabolism transcriptional activator